VLPLNNKPRIALILACAALVLAGYAVYTARASGGASANGGACVDQNAREQVALLRRALVERDALVAQLARAAHVPAAVPSPTEAPTEPPSEAPPRPEVALDVRRRRYARFDSPNPAVSVTQNADGSYEIRTTDPALAGTILQVTAVTPSGDEDKVFIRVPQP
jgi:hypothetical protein